MQVVSEIPENPLKTAACCLSVSGVIRPVSARPVIYLL